MSLFAIVILAGFARPVAAEDMQPDRFYQTRQQAGVGWILAAAMVGLSLVVLLEPSARNHGGYVIALVGIVIAAGCGRFARCGVRVTAHGVRVTNMVSRTDLAWEQIKGFELSPVGACLIGLKDGKWVSMTGIEQTNLAWLTKRHNTQERQMTAELNELLQEHTAADHGGAG